MEKLVYEVKLMFSVPDLRTGRLPSCTGGEDQLVNVVSQDDSMLQEHSDLSVPGVSTGPVCLCVLGWSYVLNGFAFWLHRSVPGTLRVA